MPDIQYLLFLQNFRNSTNNLLTPFMEWISLFAVTHLILIPVLRRKRHCKADCLHLPSMDP